MNTQTLISVSLLLIALAVMRGAEAGQGCPFDDGSCQEYCSQQGCNMGYCGHFAWIQCICRKCGDEWSWYDKVRYNPDKTVNQTELDSLKLNETTPMILTSAKEAQNKAKQEPQSAKEQQAATLTTLLIPDLSDTSGKLDLNDIPDENSDKFLDYLAKNHEKLVQATSQARSKLDESSSPEDDEDEQEEQTSHTTPNPIDDTETIEIQISSSNKQQKQQQNATTKPDASSSPLTRVLKMAVMLAAEQ